MVRLYPLDPQVAASIARRRRAAGLSQNAIALATGLTEAAVTKYETLRTPIPPEKLAAIEHALAEAEGRKVAAAR